MYQYQVDELKAVLAGIIRQNTTPEVATWLEEKSAAANAISFHTAFAALPRKTAKPVIHLTPEEEKKIVSVRPGFSVQGWTIDRLARVGLLLQPDPSGKEKYIRTIENLFTTAEMNELVALYSALPVLAYPEVWKRRCAEGIRSNIGPVLEAIMCNNPYPAENLDEAAWNQLVLKAFFTEKPVHEIVGLNRRANAELANILSDYAHERWAAHRPVNPQLWRCVGPFINEHIFPDIERIANSENRVEREAAALACHDSNYPQAKELVSKTKQLKSDIDSGELTWTTLAQKSILNK